jgi:hypothetical protein
MEVTDILIRIGRSRVTGLLFLIIQRMLRRVRRTFRYRLDALGLPGSYLYNSKDTLLDIADTPVV